MFDFDHVPVVDGVLVHIDNPGQYCDTGVTIVLSHSPGQHGVGPVKSLLHLKLLHSNNVSNHLTPFTTIRFIHYDTTDLKCTITRFAHVIARVEGIFNTQI